MECVLCKLESDQVVRANRGAVTAWNIDCPRCGRFAYTTEAKDEFDHLPDGNQFELSSWCAERFLAGRPRPSIVSTTYQRQPDEEGAYRVSEILQIYAPKNISERLDRILLAIADWSKEPPNEIEFSEDSIYRCFSKNADQMIYYLTALNNSGWLSAVPNLPGNARLTPEGWQQVHELQRESPAGERVFIAMAFTDELESAWHDGIRPGVEDAGLLPIRVDKQEHNEKICDLIVAEIRKSCLLVADVTEHRHGVYFEAGFALGLGIPVVWCCRRDQLEQCHFDTRQYNHIVWDDPSDLRLRLQRRIEATR